MIYSYQSSQCPIATQAFQVVSTGVCWKTNNVARKAPLVYSVEIAVMEQMFGIFIDSTSKIMIGHDQYTGYS